MKIALLIGNSDYKDKHFKKLRLSSHPNAGDNIRSMQTVLNESNFIREGGRIFTCFNKSSEYLEKICVFIEKLVMINGTYKIDSQVFVYYKGNACIDK